MSFAKHVWIAAALLAAASVVAAAGFDSARLSMESFGPVRVGMTIADAQRAADGTESQLDLASPMECGFLRVVKDPGVRFMVEEGRVTRIDIMDAHHLTLSGVGIGDTEAHAQNVYGGRLEVRPHKDISPGHYLILRSRDRKLALVLETDGTRITHMRAGSVPSVEYVEACA